MRRNSRRKSGSAHRKQPWYTVIIARVDWIVFSAIFLWLVLFITTGEQFLIVRWVSYVAPWLAGLLWLLTLTASLSRKKFLAISMFILSMVISFPYIQLFFPSHVKILEGQSVYKVMTYSKMGRNHDIDSVARVVMNVKPDILFMQEISGQDAERLIHLLSGIYSDDPLFYLADKFSVILSRYKVTSFLKKGDYSLSAGIALPEKLVKVWNVHLQKSISSTDMQNKMVNQLADQITLASDPIIAAGDFNATEINYPYARMRQHLDNAFERAGFGFGFTFPSPARRMGTFTPFMRIDHIFYSNHFNIHNAYVVKDSGSSDHYPVVALLSLK